MKETLKQYLRDEEGLTTVEYAVAGALISAALVGTFVLLGDEVAAVIASVTRAYD